MVNTSTSKKLETHFLNFTSLYRMCIYDMEKAKGKHFTPMIIAMLQSLMRCYTFLFILLCLQAILTVHFTFGTGCLWTSKDGISENEGHFYTWKPLERFKRVLTWHTWWGGDICLACALLEGGPQNACTCVQRGGRGQKRPKICVRTKWTAP